MSWTLFFQVIFFILLGAAVIGLLIYSYFDDKTNYELSLRQGVNRMKGK